MKLFRAQQHTLVLIIGDEGAILMVMRGSTLVTRLFATEPTEKNTKEMTALFHLYPLAPLYILLDNIDQTYTEQTLPAVSPLAITSLVKKRLERDYGSSPLRGSLPMGKEKKGRKDWRYLFIAASITPHIQAWMDYATSLADRFLGIYLLPIELESVLTQLNKKFFTKEKPASKWQFIVCHNKTGGFRQVIFRNGRILFTRLIRPEKENLPDLLAGNVEQEIANTNEYLRRLGFTDTDGLDTIIIVAKDIKQSIDPKRIYGSNVFLLTPHEAAQHIGLGKTTHPDDKFADLFIAALFANTKKHLRLNTTTTEILTRLTVLHTVLMRATVIALPLVLLGILITIASIWSLNRNIKKVENEKIAIEKAWREAQDVGNYDINEATQITNIVTLHTLLLSDIKSPIDMVETLHKVNQTDALVSSYEWTHNKNLEKLEEIGLVGSTITVQFLNTGANVEELFANFDAYTTRLKNAFTGYTVEHTKLPEIITFDKAEQALDITVHLDEKKP